MTFRIKQWIKMLLQNVVLPLIYSLYRTKPVEKGLVIFADAHHTKMPFSMRKMAGTMRDLQEHYQENPDGQAAGETGCGPEKLQSVSNVADDTARLASVKASIIDGDAIHPVGAKTDAEGGDAAINGPLRIETFITDFDSLSFGAMAKYLLRFMRRYAVAEYVFICDYFLPVSSCRKRPETKVIQLWHSCGLTKKIAYDTEEDIPKGYHGNMFDNYTYLTMSAEVCVPVHEWALRLSREHIFATGISRTDYYFDEAWNARCRAQFQTEHPEAAGKKVALWAPTFRGNAAMPVLEGLDVIQKIANESKDEWYFVIKAHPHIDRHGQVSNSSIPTEELFPVADVLITDYSSVLFDYLLYRRPVILYAPDLTEYEQARGFYIDYRSIPFPLAQTEEELRETLQDEIFSLSRPAEPSVQPTKFSKQTVVSIEQPTEFSEQPDVSIERPTEFSEQTAGSWYLVHADEIDEFRETYVGACDGHATERILKLAGLAEPDADVEK
ncbi:MAG: CDP-glycerol glycerophosphotransferase family protein [Lachnospiraceae bacterium]|nr:CDP-glycerol glycerophosphotransferase family protein [Lachnospiraceae bacterium]